MAKSKKPSVGGAAYRRAHGIRAILVPLSVEAHHLVSLAAGTYVGPERAVSRWAARALEEAARARLEEVRRGQ